MTCCDHRKDNDRNCDYDPNRKPQSFANVSGVFEAAAWPRAHFRVFAGGDKQVEREIGVYLRRLEKADG